MGRTGRSAWRRRAAEGFLDAAEQSGKLVGLARREPAEQGSQARAKEALGRAEHGCALGSQRERVPASVGLGRRAFHPAGDLQRRDELRDRRSGHTSALREIDGAQRLCRDRPQRRELTERQRRLMCCQKPLDPPARQRCHTDQCIGGCLGMAWTRND